MRKILQALILFLSIQSLSFSQSPIIQTIINQTNIDSLTYFVRELSGDVQTIIGGSPYTIVSRHKNQPGNDKAADYIKQKLNSYGLVTYDQNFSSTAEMFTVFNLVLFIQTKNILSALIMMICLQEQLHQVLMTTQVVLLL